MNWTRYQALANSQPKTQEQRKSPVQLDIIVVGAGLSGLASAIGAALSGHHVTVYESAKELLEVSVASNCLVVLP
jgi:glycerol-3-phosphate dehydrogenase